MAHTMRWRRCSMALSMLKPVRSPNNATNSVTGRQMEADAVAGEGWLELRATAEVEEDAEEEEDDKEVNNTGKARRAHTCPEKACRATKTCAVQNTVIIE